MKRSLYLLSMLMIMVGYTYAQVSTFNYTGSAQTYTVPAGVFNIHIDARGAQGGGSSFASAGGLGARMTGDFAVTPGQVLTIIVGQQGLLQVGGQVQNSSGGGGGTFVYDAIGPVLFVAAGGGGGKCNYDFSVPLHSGAEGQITADGGASSDGNAGGIGGNGGNAGLWSAVPCAGGGTGWLTPGGGPYGGLGLSTWTGGPGYCGGGGGGCGGVGGFGGGGGGGNHYGGGGGGGGYSGGGGGTDPTHGGGGGSYSIGINQINTAGFQSADGIVIITPLGGGPCSPDLTAPVIVGCPSNMIVDNDLGDCSAVVNFTTPTVTDNCPALGTNRYYLRSNINSGSEPWGVNDNIVAMDAAFGVGNWTGDFFETVNVGTLFSNATRFVALEGGNNTADELNSFLSANITAIENWVNAGGSLYINAAPNEGGNINLGFGGTTLGYPVFCGTGNAVNAAHPIFTTPTAVSTSYSGNFFAHANVTGTGLTNLIADCGASLAYKPWGPGNVVFGGMTFQAAITPSPDYQNLLTNIFEWVDGMAISGTLSISQTAGLASGSVFPAGVTTNTFLATDANGNTSTCSFTVTVNDTEAPALTACPSNVNISTDAGTCGAVVNYTTPTATDNCSSLASGDVYYIRSNSTGGEPWFENGNVDAMDAVYGVGSWNSEYFETAVVGTVFSATTKFVFLDGSDSHADELNTFLAANMPAMEAWVNNGGVLFINAAPNESGNIDFGFSGTLLNYDGGSACDGPVDAVNVGDPIFLGPFTPVATSYTGNSFSHSHITGTGLTDVLQGCGFIQLAYKAWGTGNVAFGGMTTPNFHSPNPEAQNLRQNIIDWLDGLAPGSGSGSFSQTSGLASGSTFPIGTTTNTFEAIDGSGNSSVCSFTVTISDDEAPVADNANIDVTEACAVTLTAPTATDNCAGAITGTTADPLTYSAQGNYTVTWTYDDGNGNTTTQTQSVTVADTEAPVADNANIDVNDDCAITLTAPTATDNCAGAITGTTSDPLTYSAQGNYTVTWTYDDGNGNTTTQTQFVTVADGSEPLADVATLPTLSGCNVTVSVTPTATDACEGAINGTTSDPLTYSTPGSFTVTWTYDDGNGNTSTQTQSVTVIDCSGIEDETGVSFNLYPNPSNGVFTLTLSELPTGGAQIRVLDELGKVLYTNEIMELTHSYDFSYLSAATYYIQIISNDVNVTKTLIITNKQ